MARNRGRSASRRALTLVLLGSIVCMPRAGFADSTSGRAKQSESAPIARLSWVRGPGAEACPSLLALEEAVSQRLRRDPFDRGARRTIEVLGTHDGTQWTARIVVIDDEGRVVGERTIHDLEASCEPLFQSVALAIALTIDPSSALEGAPEPPAEASASPPAYRGAVTARAVLALGLLPEAMAGPALGVGVAIIDGLYVTFGAYWLPEAPARNGSFSFGLTAGWLGLCYRLVGVPYFSLALCAEVHAGAIHAVVHELIPTTPGDQPWAAGAAALALGVPIHDFLVDLRTQLVLPITSYAFHIEATPSELVFQQSLPSLLVGIGAGFRFR